MKKVVRTNVGKTQYEYSVTRTGSGYRCTIRTFKEAAFSEETKSTLAGVVDFFGNGELARELYDELGIDYEG